MYRSILAAAVVGLALASCGQIDDQGRSPAGAGQGGGSKPGPVDAPSDSAAITPDTTIPQSPADVFDSLSLPVEGEPSALVSGRDGGNFRVTFPAGWLDGQGDGTDHRFLRPGEAQDLLGSVAMVSVFKNSSELQPDLVGIDAQTQDGRFVKIYDDSHKGFPPVTLLHVDMGDFIVGLAVTNSSPTIIDELLVGLRAEEVK